MKNAIVAVLLSFALALGVAGEGMARMNHGGMMGPQKGMMQKGVGVAGQQNPCMMSGMRDMMGMGRSMMGMMGPMGFHGVFKKAMKVAATDDKRQALSALEKEVASKCAALMVEMMQQRDLWREYMMKEGCSSQNTQKHYQLMLQARDKLAKARMNALADIEKIIGKEKMRGILGQTGMMGMGQN